MKSFLSIVENVLFWLFVTGIFGILCWQNTVLSSQWNTLFFRDINDYSLLLVIKQIHQDLMQGHFQSFFSTFAYGYGFLFWGGYSLATLPFAMGDSVLGVQFVSRFLSVVASFGAVYFAGRIFSLYSPNKSLKKTFCLFLLFSPALMEWAICVHMNAQTLFWGVLGLYIFLKNRDELNRKALVLSAVCVGAAVGAKITGLFWVPLFYLLILNSKDFLKKGLVFSLALLPATLFFAFPKALLFPFFRKEVSDVFATLAYYIAFKGVNYGPPEYGDPIYNLTNGFAEKFTSPYILLILLSVGLWHGLKLQKKERREYLALLLWPLFILSYILLSLKKGPAYIGGYYLTVYVLIAVGFVGFDRFKKFASPLAMLVLLFHFYFEFGYFKELLFKHSDVASSETFRQLDEISQELKSIIGPLTGKKIIFVRSHTTILPYSLFDREKGFEDHFCDATDLLSDECVKGTAEFLMLRTADIPTIESLSRHAMGAELYERSRTRALAFLEDSICGGLKYVKVLDRHGILVFQKPRL